jgi:hypothetical protein
MQDRKGIAQENTMDGVLRWASGENRTRSLYKWGYNSLAWLCGVCISSTAGNWRCWLCTVPLQPLV